MKRWIPWMAAAIVVAVLGASVWRALASRQAQQAQLAQASADKSAATLALTAAEWSTVQRQQITLGVAVSGALRAVETALVKARVAGELQGLTVREGDTVRAGQEIARIDPTELQARLRQAQQQADAARAQVEINQRQYTNNRALVDQGFISPTALVTSQSSLEAAQATYQAAMAAVDVARKALQDTVLRSPISGQVSQRLAQPGERIAVDGRVIEVVDISRLELEAQLNPSDSLAVRVGQTAQLTVEGQSSPVPATVVRINPSAQSGSRTVPVYLRVDTTKAQAPLRQGLFVQGTLDVGRTDALTVPLDAVRTDRPAPYVQAVRDGRVNHVPVQTGARAPVNGTVHVAVTGIDEGTPVIAGRIGALREGTAVTLGQTPAPAPAPTPAASRTAP